MSSLIQFIKTHFEVNRHQAISIISGLLIFLAIIAAFIVSEKNINSAEVKLMLNDYDNLDIKLSKIKSQKLKEKTAMAKATNHLIFNPNNAALEALLNNGIPKYIANNLINFRNKGKIYKTKEELLKVYGMTEEVYLEIEAYIDLPSQEDNRVYGNFETTSSKSPKKPTFEPKKIESFDINLASKEELIQIRGIGEVFANRIIKYREGLGGFYEVEQLKTTYGLADSTFQELKKHIYIQEKPLKIKINEIDINDWKSSILKLNQKKVIIAYRKQHGNFEQLEDLNNIKILNANDIERLSHYLDFSVPN